MGASYFSALKDIINDELVFNAIVTIDRFHVAKLVGEKVDKRRKKLVAELKQNAQDDPETLEQIKGTMWPFRQPPKGIDEDQAIIRSVNPKLKCPLFC